MGQIFSDGGNDGSILSEDTSSFDAARDATAGDYAFRTFTTRFSAISVGHYPLRGGGERWNVERAFLSFDTSTIGSGQIDTDYDVIVSVYGSSALTADFFVVKSAHSSEFTTADFDAITGWGGSGNQESNVTKYSAEIDVSGWANHSYNSVTLNAAAITAMEDDDIVKLCFIESVHDLRDSDSGLDGSVPPAEVFSTGMTFSDYTGTSRDPYLGWTDVVTTTNATFFGANF